MINRINAEYVPRMRVLIFADLMYYCTVIIENTQAQYFDNLISNCSECSQEWLWLCIKFAKINSLFLATFSEHILLFCQNKVENTATCWFEGGLFTKIYSLFHCFVWHRFPPSPPPPPPPRPLSILIHIQFTYQGGILPSDIDSSFWHSISFLATRIGFLISVKKFKFKLC